MNARSADLEDLASIDLDDAFIEANIHRDLSERFSRQALQDVCTAFVNSFLVQHGDRIVTLHHSLNECSAVLKDMEAVLEAFILQLDSIHSDIGEVRETLAQTAVSLANTRASEHVLWAAVSRLVVPPEVVQVVTQSNEEQLGTQFQLCVRELLKYLNYRKGTWRPTLGASASSKAVPAVSSTSPPRPTSSSGARADTFESTLVSLHGELLTSPSTETLTSSPSRPTRGGGAAPREVRLPLSECQAYAETSALLDGLTLYACVKIKAFLSRKLSVLTIKNTNVCIQQEHTLKPFSFYVHFLRSAGPLLRYAPPHTAPSAGNGDQREKQTAAAAATTTGSATSNHLLDASVAHRIVRSLYDEFKREYGAILSHLYLRRIQEYVMRLNSMEYSTVSTGSGGGFFSGGGTSTSHPTSSYGLPLLTDTKNTASFVAMRLGDRGDLLRHPFAPPLIPVMEKAAHRRHSYEETFRSVLNLICDVVTHEYLFTYQFFSGDMTVYVDVFKPTLQFLVDYLSEVVLTQSSGEVRRMLNERPYTSVNVNAKQDCYGLLILIRLCHEYRALMKNVRKLPCLDGFFDSLLVLLWPAFKNTFDRQLVSLRVVQITTLTASMTHLARIEDKLRFVHPLVQCFTEFSCVILSITLGTLIGEADTTHLTDDGAGGSPMTPVSAQGLAHSPSPGSPLLPDTSVHTGDSVAALRMRALELITQEEEGDAADSANRFEVLLGNIAFMRVEVIHLLEGVVQHVLSQEGEGSVWRRFPALSNCFLLNNMYYMLVTPHTHPVLGEEGEGLTVAEKADFTALQERYTTMRIDFVQCVIAMHFPAVCHIVQHDDACTPEEVVQAADQFLLRWKASLDGVRNTVHQLIADRVHEQEVVAQACMECLLYNTRFHAAVAKCMEAHKEAFVSRPIRSLIVTNQQLLQHMRTFSSVVDPQQPQQP